MRAYIAVAITLILGGAALLTGQDICAAEAKAKRNGPVILMLDPQGNKLDREGRLLGKRDYTHQSSLIIFSDLNGNALGIAEVPGLASSHLVTAQDRAGMNKVLEIKDGEFRRHLDIAVATMESVLSASSRIYEEDGYCGYTFCLREPGGWLGL